MRIGLLSDIHGNPFALRAALSRLEGVVDQILFAGDIVGYYPFAEECVTLLREHEALAVKGNHDAILTTALAGKAWDADSNRAKYGSALERAIPQLSETSRTWITASPITRTLKLGGLRVLVVHGAPWDPLHGRVYPDFTQWGRFLDVDADVVVCGHTHYALTHQEQEVLVVNPGSVGQPRDSSDGASFAVLDLDAEPRVSLERAAYDREPLVDDARRHDSDLKYLVEVLYR